jgi:signal transduction histidine kinase
VVSEFLQLGRPLELEPESLPVRTVLEEALVPQRIRAEKEGIRLHCEPVADGSIRLDRRRFTQVVTNLVGNAFDAVGPGGEVRVSIRLGSAGLHLAVQDNGAGMDSETLERVQRPFVTTKARGTGLGLSIARRLVEAHGGDLQLSSVPGKGTEARVFLPRSGPARED